jgi:hypothetical protein
VADQGKTDYVFDSETGIIKINGKEFKLSRKLEDMVDFSGRVMIVSRCGGAIAGTIAAFERGEWVSYANAGSRIKELHAEENRIKVEMLGLSSEFDKFFEPVGLRDEFGGDSLSFTRLIRVLVKAIAKE